MTSVPATIGRYQIERLIAHGGMGSLYLARDPAIDRRVAIKLLREGFDDDAARERFAHEARAAGQLHHPNIVTVFDVGEHENRPFIAMEFVTGETVAQLIKRRAFFRMWQRLALLEDLCTGLHYAHSAGIIHRDIKPANVMRDNSGVIKILDFGIARAGTVSLTRAGDVVGTLNYMSPEQLLGEAVDQRSDIYAVGAFAYELITTQMAFPGTVDTGVLSKILHATRVPVASLVPGIDPDIVAVIDQAMARQPEARYPDLESMRDDLATIRQRLLATQPIEEVADPEAETRVESGRVASGTQPRPASRPKSALQQAARIAAEAPPTQAAPAAAEAVPTQAMPASGRSRKTGWVAAAAAAAIAGAVGVGLWLNRSTDNSAQQQQQTVAPVTEPAAVAPAAPSTSTPPPVAEPPPATVPPAAPVTTEPAVVDKAEVRRRLDEQLRDIRALARRQVAAGQRESALATLVRGLSLDEKDAELNDLVDDLSRVSRQGAAQARNAAARRGAGAAASREFREGDRLERTAEGLLRAYDRRSAIETFWAAAASYNRVPAADREAPTIPSAPAPAPAPPPVVVPEPPSPKPANPVPSPPVAEPMKPLPAPPDKPAAPPVAPATPKVETPPSPPPDPRAADLAGIREALRGYVAAYQSLDSDEVGRVMPSLTADQLRQLRRDFSNYRSYTAEIRNEQITLDGARATVACEVMRRFETKTGVGGSNTSQTTFHLRKTGSAWTIERIDSR